MHTRHAVLTVVRRLTGRPLRAALLVGASAALLIGTVSALPVQDHGPGGQGTSRLRAATSPDISDWNNTGSTPDPEG